MQFAAEMVNIFEQRVHDRFADGRFPAFVFVLAEFFGVMKGAYVMWFSKILKSDTKPSKLSVTTPKVHNAEEGIKLRQDAIRRMVAAIADHDFVTARHHSDEEVRLRHAIEDLQGTPVAPLKFA
jgi:hypothetical protein